MSEPTFLRRTTRLAVTLLLGLLAPLCLTPVPGRAAPTPSTPGTMTMTSQLCGRTGHCSIGVAAGSVMRQGSSYQVTVRGAPRQWVAVRAWAVDLDSRARFAGMHPYTSYVETTTGSDGTASITLTFQPWRAPITLTSPWVFIGPIDADPRRPQDAVGQFVPAETPTPTLLGDGWGTDKPVGQPLDLRHAGLPARTDHVVQYLDARSWHPAAPHDGTDVTQTSTDRPDEVTTTRYEVPRGLLSKPYRFRLLDVVHGTTAASWTVRPSDHPARADVLTLWTPPDVVGARPTRPRPAHTGRLTTATRVATGACALAAVVLVWATRRRSVTARPREPRR